MEKKLFEHQGIPVYRYTGSVAPRYALLLLPGIGGYGGYYDPFCAVHVEKGAEIWGMDPLGHGRSIQRRGLWTLEAYLAEVVALASYIRSETKLPVFTMGSSLGSGAAFYAMALSKDIVGGVAMGICIASAGWMPEERKLFESADVQALMALFGSVLELNIFRMIRLEDNYGASEMVARIKADPLVSERYDLSSYASFLTYEPPLPPSANVKPFLMAVGGADPLFPPDQVEAIFANIGGPKTLSIYPDAPHQLMFFRTQAFSTEIDGWAREQLLALV